jgi:hypothetical protein
VEKQNLPDFIEIIKNSFIIFFKRQNFLYFLKIMLLNLAVTMALMLLLVPLVGLLSKQNYLEQVGPVSTVFIPTLALVLGFLVWSLLIKATVVVSVSRVISGEGLEVKETLKVAWRKLGRYFLTNLLTSLIMVIGYILLIVPGVVFTVWYSFSQYIVITQDVGPIQALKASKKLVSGRFWPVFGRLFGITVFFLVLQIVLSSIRLVGPIAALLFSPYYVLAPYLLFEGLKRSSAKASA